MSQLDFGLPVLDVNNGKGHITMYLPKPGLVFFRGEGFMTVDLWAPQEPIFAKAFSLAPKIRIFRDVYAVRTLEPAYREASQKNLRRDRELIDEVVYLTGSALVRLSVNAAALFSRATVVATTDRADFEARLAAALAR